MFKVLISPDSFKGSVDARAAARAIARGVKSVRPDAVTVELPIADGGEGTLDVLTAESERYNVVSAATDGRRLNAEYGVVGERAIIEMARAAGLGTVPENERDPERSTTVGVGLMILSALDRGCREIMLTLGGSGSNDGGVGMLEALGARLYSGDELISDIRAGDMARITSIDVSSLDKRLYETKFTLACDVNNPLYGERGATYVYGRQKGADDAMLDRLERGMKNYAACMARLTDDASSCPGTGAGGGVGFPLVALFGATVRSGIESVLEVIGYEEKLHGVSLVITGEGKIDRQSAYGKAISGVANAAMSKGIPVLALVGVKGEGADEMKKVGVCEIRALTELTQDKEYSISHGEELLEALAAKAVINY